MPRLSAIFRIPPAPETPVNIDDASTSRANTTVPRTATEKAEALLASIEHPDFNRYLSDVSSLKPSEKNQRALINFQNDSDVYNSFRKNMKERLCELRDNQFGGTQGTQNFAKYEQLIKDLELDKPKHGTKKYGSQLFQLYSHGCLLFKQLLIMLNEAKESPKDFPFGALDACKPLVLDLESELLICGDGLMQKLANQTTEIRHTLFPPSIHEVVEKKRVNTAEALIRERVVPQLNLGRRVAGNEIHVVKTWMDQIKHQLNLATNNYEDRYANCNAYFDELPYNIRKPLIKEIQKHTSHSKIIEGMASEKLEDLKRALSELPDQQRKDFGEVRNLVQKLATNDFGRLPASALLRPLNQARPELHQEPSLLVAELLDKYNQESVPKSGEMLKPMKFQLDEGNDFVLCLWGTSCWTEFTTGKQTERAPLELDDLSDAKALEIVKAIAEQHETLAHFIVAPFLNHPAYGQMIAPLLSGQPHHTTIATAAYLCSITNETEPCRFMPAFAFMIENQTLSARSVIDLLSQLNFSDEQIDTALGHIKASGFNHFGWEALKNECLTERSNTLNPHLFKTLMRDVSVNSEMFDKLISSFSAAANIANLKLVFETFTDSELDRSKAAIIRLTDHDNPTTNPEAIDYLISLVQDDEPSTFFCENLLEFSILWTSDDIAAIVAKKWINSGGTDFKNDMGMNAVSSAADMHALKTLNVLIENNNFQVQDTDRHNLTALDHALISLRDRPNINLETAFKVCELLLSRGVSPNHSIIPATRTWHAALENNLPEPESTKLLKLFLRAGAEDSDSPASFKAVDHACASLEPEKLEALLEYPDRFKVSKLALHRLARLKLVRLGLDRETATQDDLQKKIAIIKILKPTPADLDRLDEEGKTPIDHAIEGNNHALVLAMFKQAGNINQLDQEGYARLHKAVINKDETLVRLLVQAGANVNLRTTNQHAGKTALHLAVRNKDESMQTLLKTLGANSSIRDYRGRTAGGYQSWKRNP